MLKRLKFILNKTESTSMNKDKYNIIIILAGSNDIGMGIKPNEII